MRLSKCEKQFVEIWYRPSGMCTYLQLRARTHPLVACRGLKWRKVYFKYDMPLSEHGTLSNWSFFASWVWSDKYGIIFLNLFGFSWLFNYANQELFLYTSSLRSIHKEFHSSCVDFQFHLCSILQKKYFSFQQRRIFVLMICRNKSLSKSSRLDSVKYLPYLFILGVCFQSYFLYHIFTFWIKFDFIRFSFVDVFWKQSIVIVIFIFSIYLRIAFHAGDNIIVGSREGKLCWFDMDLSSKPYRILKYVLDKTIND